MPVIETSLAVDAPPAAVWRVLTDFAGYPAWNPLTVGVDGRVEVGATLRLRVMLRGRVRRVGARVLVVTPERELRWGGGVRPLVWVEHWVRLAPEGAGTRIDHGESFVGMLAGLGTRLLGLSPAPYHAVNAALGARARAAP